MASENDWESFTFSTGEIKKALVERLTGEEFTPEIEKEINDNGVPDIYDLGVRICRFNVGRIKEQGELAKAAEAKATQKQKIKGALVELDFLKEQTKDITALDVPAPTALNAVQVQMNKAEKKVNVYEGLDKGTEVVGLVIAQLLDRVGSPKDSGEKKKQE